MNILRKGISVSDTIKTKLGLGIILAVGLIAGYCGACGGSSSSGSSTPPYEAKGITDTAFGVAGVVTTTIDASHSAIKRIACQADGKILAGGYSNDSSIVSFALLRYTTAGALDDTFGISGVVTTTIGASSEICGITLQTDGKIVACGLSDGNLAIARYTITGTLDAAFSTDGIVTDTALSYYSTNDVVIQSDGKIVIGGAYNDGTLMSCLTRYTATGALDTTFGVNGVVTSTIGTYYLAPRITRQSDDKIIAAGYASAGGGDNYFALTRYTADGALDDTFGISGVVTTTFGTGLDDGAQAVAMQADGKILAGGWSLEGTPYGIALCRYTSSGVLDTAFDSDGVVTTNITAPINSTETGAYAIAVQSNGKIVVAGCASTGGPNYFFLARYAATGALDTSFGANGVLVGRMGGTSDYFDDMLIQPDGYIVGAGCANYGGMGYFGLARFK